MHPSAQGRIGRSLATAPAVARPPARHQETRRRRSCRRPAHAKSRKSHSKGRHWTRRAASLRRRARATPAVPRRSPRRSAGRVVLLVAPRAALLCSAPLRRPVVPRQPCHSGCSPPKVVDCLRTYSRRASPRCCRCRRGEGGVDCCGECVVEEGLVVRVSLILPCRPSSQLPCIGAGADV